MYFYLILFLLCLKVPFVHNSIFSLASSTVGWAFTFQIQRFLSLPKAKTKKFRLDLPLHPLLSVTLLLYIPVWFTSLNHPVSKPHPCRLISCFVATHLQCLHLPFILTSFISTSHSGLPQAQGAWRIYPGTEQSVGKEVHASIKARADSLQTGAWVKAETGGYLGGRMIEWTLP